MTTTTDMKPTQTFVVLLAIEGVEVAENLPEIIKAVSHVPKYWSCTAEEREIVARLYANPTVIGNTLKFSLDLELSADRISGLHELFDEMAKKCHTKFLILKVPGTRTDITPQCVYAIGGTKEHVVAEATAMKASQDDRLEQLITAADHHAASAGLGHFEVDMEGLLKEAWTRMSTEQRNQLAKGAAATHIFKSINQANPFIDPAAVDTSAPAPNAPGY